jgi:hypothetical protein
MISRLDSPTARSVLLSLVLVCFASACERREVADSPEAGVGIAALTDPCPTNNGGCSPDATCTWSGTVRWCTCNSGFTGNGLTCANINDCAASTCAANAGGGGHNSCVDGVNSFTCICGQGFTPTAAAVVPASCVEINECATPETCGSGAQCWNTFGGYECRCLYANDITTCVNGNLADPWVFNAAYYRSRYSPELSSYTDGQLLTHWINQGVDEGRRASATFDPDFYSARYPAQVTKFAASRAHVVADWANTSRRAGYQGTDDFDPVFYLSRYPDVAQTYGATNYERAIYHWVTSGRAAGRQGVNPAQMFSNAGTLTNRTCVSLNEPNDPDTGWGDNYWCSAIDGKVQWSVDGTIAGRRCTNINEPDDMHGSPNGWANNNICVPAYSNLNLQWSNSGTVAGKTCVAWNETSDPSGWHDNYLCYDQRYIFSEVARVTGYTCIPITEPRESTTNGWTNNYFCSATDEGIRWSSIGPISGMRCTQITEPSDLHGVDAANNIYPWSNNYLCVPPTSATYFHWSHAGVVTGKTCVPWPESSDASGWNDNYLCYAPCVATDTTCDNWDDDCDGARDEDYVVVATTCGVGACASTGFNTCQVGVVMNSCLPD